MKYPPAKRSHPFGMPFTPFDPRTGARMPASVIEPLVKTVVIVSEHGDFLLCTNSKREQVMVAKPYLFRRFVFDGKTVGGVVYEYLRDDYRHAVQEDDETVEEFQFITPTYSVGEALAVVDARSEIHVDDADTLVVCLLLDMNTAGRCWAVGDEEEEA